MFSALTEFFGPQKKVVTSSLNKLLFAGGYGTTHWVDCSSGIDGSSCSLKSMRLRFDSRRKRILFGFFASMPGEYTVTQQ